VDPSGRGLPATVAASTFSVFVSDTNAVPTPRVILESFDLNGSFLEEQDLLSLGATLPFSKGQIHSVQFIDNGNDGHTIDDFTFGPLTVVPEPASLTLLDIGAFGLVGYGWRRRNRKLVQLAAS
jgi:hypothetical protein